jgi:hypothetical protein
MGVEREARAPPRGQRRVASCGQNQSEPPLVKQNARPGQTPPVKRPQTWSSSRAACSSRRRRCSFMPASLGCTSTWATASGRLLAWGWAISPASSYPSSSWCGGGGGAVWCAVLWWGRAAGPRGRAKAGSGGGCLLVGFPPALQLSTPHPPTPCPHPALAPGVARVQRPAAAHQPQRRVRRRLRQPRAAQQVSGRVTAAARRGLRGRRARAPGGAWRSFSFAIRLLPRVPGRSTRWASPWRRPSCCRGTCWDGPPTTRCR